ncbi:MAG: prepilin-type N-terminal cleavage/methylation domain-containing protein [Deltaproteobacteria bacterium]|nr:prepilin-type N-terminal cleavage/methylation domain-containing protein [Deltaproteobacteria bacterium]
MGLNKKGFTLIEVVMVIIILGIIGTGILMYYTGLSASPDQVTLTQATALAQEKLEMIIADKKANGFNGVLSEAPAALPAPYARFTREVEVFCVQEADLNTSNGTMPNCTDTDILAKRVRVIISWGGSSADYVTVITNH